METDNEKRAPEKADVAKDRFHNGEADEATVGEDGGKFGDLSLVQIAYGQAEEISQQRENGVRHKAEYDDEKPLLQILD